MNKLNKLLRFFKLLINQPSLINLISESTFYFQQKLNKNYPNITTLPVVSIQEIIPKFNETLTTFSFLGGGSLPTDIMLLKAMCKQFKDCSYFEIGTWRGESVINVAQVAKNCYTLNLSKEEILALNLPEDYANLHGFYSKNKSNITHLFGNSMRFDFSSLNKKMDVVFIDGNHSYEFVKNDTKKVFKHLIHENSVVIWHDYAFNPEKIREEILVGILDALPKNEHPYLYHVSNTMCAIYTKQKLNTQNFNPIVKPEFTFEVTAKLKEISS